MGDIAGTKNLIMEMVCVCQRVGGLNQPKHLRDTDEQWETSSGPSDLSLNGLVKNGVYRLGVIGNPKTSQKHPKTGLSQKPEMKTLKL